MTETTSDKQMRKYLAAFADGEMEVQESLQVLEHMAMNPAATRRVMHHQQMRRLVDRSMRDSAPPTPESLRLAIEKAAVSSRPSRTGRVLARIGRWAPVAIAAAMVIAATVMFNQHVDPPATNRPVTAALVSDRRAAMFERRHLDCSQTLDKLIDRTSFPSQISELPETLNREFPEHKLPSLDLSSLGYEFKGAGHCNVPGTAAVHLVYQSTSDSQKLDSISLWITPYQGQVVIKEYKLYLSQADTDSHPIMIWRTGDMIYYLVGDRLDELQQVAMRLLPSQS